MTENKQIIDEIDVSKCKDFHYGECLNPAETVSACENCPSCLFKQLARKIQECEELKKANDEKNELLAKLGCPTIATAKMKAHCLQEQLDKLKAEKEQAEQKLKRIKDICKNGVYDEFHMSLDETSVILQITDEV